MKTKHILLSAAICFTVSAFSQSEFKKSWETKVDVENKWNSCNPDLSKTLIGNLKSFSMVDGLTGKILWTFNVKDKLGVKSVEDWTFLWAKEGEPVEVVYKKDKQDDKITIYLNSQTGSIESSVTENTLRDKKNSIKSSIGKNKKIIFANECYDQASETELDVTYKDRFLKDAMSGSMMEITVTAHGGYSWKTNLKGKCVRHLCNNLLSYDEPEMMVNISVSNERVFVVYEGITVLDLKTGKELWSTTFDNVQTSVGLRAKQEIGRSPMPVTSKDAVYICDFSKGEKAIKKLNINTGAELWRSEKLSNDDVISQLIITEDALIAKFGGTIRIEKFIPDANGGIGDGIYKAYSAYEGESAIKSYDIRSGKQLWDTEKSQNKDKFSRSECTVISDNNKIIACSDKSFHLLDAATGNTIAKAELGKEIGKPKTIFVHNENYIVEGEEGIASFTAKGIKNYAVSTNKILFTEFRGDAFIIWTGKDYDNMNEFIRFDLASGKIYGKLKGCYRPRFNEDGNYFIRFNDQTVTKYQTY